MDKIVALLLTVLGAIVGVATPEIRALVKKDIAGWEQAASKTPNKFDDILVQLVKGLLGM